MLATLTPTHIRLIMGFSLFPVGLLAMIGGMLILAFGPYRDEAKVLAQQSARISQKGLTDNITLVAQSATSLVDAVNSLIRTTSGNAIVLIVVGAAMEAAAYWILVGYK